MGCTSTPTPGSHSCSQPSPSWAVCCTIRTRATASEHRQVAGELERRDLLAVGLPLRALVAQEEVEDVLAERLGHQLRGLERLDRVGQRARQRRDAECTPLAVRERPDVVLGAVRQVVTLLDAL